MVGVIVDGFEVEMDLELGIAEKVALNFSKQTVNHNVDRAGQDGTTQSAVWVSTRIQHQDHWEKESE